jgi:capsid protein
MTDRLSAIRGVPVCQSAFPMLHRINDVCDSEAIAWQLLARLALSVTRQEGPKHATAESVNDPNKSENALAARLTEMDYALIYHGNPGDEIRGIERNIPAQNFSESLRMFLRLLGLPLGLPLEFVLLDWTQSNYSQSRAVMEQAYQIFQDWQDMLEGFFFTPLLQWKLSHWLESGLVRTTNNVTWEWIKPTFPWIDQVKEAEAYGKKLYRCLVSQTAVCKSLNTDRDDVVTLREREIEDAIERSARLEAKHGVIVPWQHFAGLEVLQVKDAAAAKAMGEGSEDEGDDDVD